VIDGQDQGVAPDMVVTAKINTGRRSMISDLLSPRRDNLRTRACANDWK